MPRLAAASLAGTAIEFYDFFVYGTAAAVILGPFDREFRVRGNQASTGTGVGNAPTTGPGVGCSCVRRVRRRWCP